MSRDTTSAIFGFFGVIAALLGILFATYGQATGAALTVLAERSSQLLTGTSGFSGFGGGFSANIIISIISMMISVVAGFFLGGAMVSPNKAIRGAAVLFMNLLRSSPWLVVLYAMLYLLPFRMTLFGTSIFVSPFIKAVIGLSLPVTAYVGECFRNGIRAVPDGQWESARALGYRRSQILRSIILPQALPLMLPNLMTTYAMLFIGTSLVVVTGTSDVLSIGKTVIASDGDEYATAIYLYILLLRHTDYTGNFSESRSHDGFVVDLSGHYHCRCSACQTNRQSFRNSWIWRRSNEMSRDTTSAIFGFFGVIAALLGILFATYGQATGAALTVLAERSSQLLTGTSGFSGFGGGFSANIIISIISMMISVVAGFFLGGAMVSPNKAIRGAAVLFMNLLRSSPWLVVLYAMLYLLPFRMTLFGTSIFVSPFIKAVIGLSLPVTAYVGECFRNGIRAVPDGQ